MEHVENSDDIIIDVQGRFEQQYNVTESGNWLRNRIKFEAFREKFRITVQEQVQVIKREKNLAELNKWLSAFRNHKATN